MTCTEKCIAYNEARSAAVAAWEAKWPDYCRDCNGAGMFRDSGDYETPPEVYPCECNYEGYCPRCRKQGLDVETNEGPCTFCGFNFGEQGGTPDDIRPPDGECVCWEEEYDRYAADMIRIAEELAPEVDEHLAQIAFEQQLQRFEP